MATLFSNLPPLFLPNCNKPQPIFNKHSTTLHNHTFLRHRLNLHRLLPQHFTITERTILQQLGETNHGDVQHQAETNQSPIKSRRTRARFGRIAKRSWKLFCDFRRAELLRGTHSKDFYWFIWMRCNDLELRFAFTVGPRELEIRPLSPVQVAFEPRDLAVEIEDVRLVSIIVSKWCAFFRLPFLEGEAPECLSFFSFPFLACDDG